MEVTTEKLLNLSAGAEKEIARILAQDNPSGFSAIRVGVKGGGCSGLTYILDLDNPQHEEDYIFEGQGYQLVINKAHALYLSGMNLSYENGLNNRGFVFENPNAKEKCGCGTSFSV